MPTNDPTPHIDPQRPARNPWAPLTVQSLFERLPYAVLALDRRWLITAASPRALAFLTSDRSLHPANPIPTGAAHTGSDAAALINTPLDRCLAPDARSSATGSVAARLAEAIDRRQGLRLRTLANATGRSIDLIITDTEAARHAAPPNAQPTSQANNEPILITLFDATERAALESELDHLRRQLADAERQRSTFDALREQLSAAAEPPTIVGSSRPILTMLDDISASAPTSSTVLILGETGTGKELVARAVHAASPRAARALVAVNCAALPESLLESELFGHERGAFTGADRRRIGKFELADSGTLFLDEIGELSLPAQAKLLRVLQEGAFERVGGAETIRVDVRVVAATHRDLVELVRKGRFREDLFYRLNVFRIAVPPLRDRKDDIKQLAEHLHRKHAGEMGRSPLPINERSIRRLLAYNWPGNVRELDNAIERATLLAFATKNDSAPIAARALDIELPEGASRTVNAASNDPLDPTRPGARNNTANASARANSEPAGRDVLLDLTLDQLQRLQIVHALERSNHRVFGPAGAAEQLGIKPQTLLSRMDKLGIPRPRAARGGKTRR
ncbi:MAG: sigma 54-interacting transcriptional regulator [Phycisphaerales bacterium]